MKLLRTTLAAAAIALTGAGAQADQLEVFGYNGGLTFADAASNLANVGNYAAGTVRWTANGGTTLRLGTGLLIAKNYTTQTSFLAFCVEPYQALSTAAGGGDFGATKETYTSTALTSPTGKWYDVQRMFDLWGHDIQMGMLAPGQTNNDVKLWGAAAQLAIWNLLLDNDLSVSAGAGLVYVDNTSTNLAIVNLANQMILSGRLDRTTVAPSKLMTFWDANGSQDIISSASVVPEPSTYAMVLVGVGIVGYSLRRRQHKAA